MQSAAKIFAVLRAFESSFPEQTICAQVASCAEAWDRGTSPPAHPRTRSPRSAICIRSRARSGSSLTPKCLELGFLALSSLGRTSVQDSVAPLLRELVPERADAASLGTLDGSWTVVYLAARERAARRGTTSTAGLAGAFARMAPPSAMRSSLSFRKSNRSLFLEKCRARLVDPSARSRRISMCAGAAG